jgi:hypothetical protein
MAPYGVLPGFIGVCVIAFRLMEGIGVLYVMAYIKNAGKPKEKASNTPHRLGALLLPVRQFIMVEKDRVGAQNVLTFSMLTNMPWPVWSLVNRVPWEVAVIVHPCAS